MSKLDYIQSRVPTCSNHVNVGIKRLRNHIELYDVNCDPDYQRDHVWTDIQAEKFVGALLENPESIPPMWINVCKDLSSELVDGKQRVHSILRWLDGEIPARCPMGEVVWIHELDEVDLRALSTNVTLSWKFVELDRKGVIDFYLRLNSGGTIHSEEELDRVRKLLEEET